MRVNGYDLKFKTPEVNIEFLFNIFCYFYLFAPN
jgi:hypothetical protein